MKRTGIIIISILVFTAIARSVEPDSLIKKANSLYEQGYYNEAIEAYSQVLEDEYISADIYYNMGNAYFKLKKTAYAILYYEKALLINPGHEEAHHNLELANAYIMDKIDVIPDIFLKRLKNVVINYFSPLGWLWISIVSFALFLILLLIYFFGTSGVAKKSGFWFGLLFLLISLFALANSFERRNSIQDSGKAIIVAPVVTVKSSPNESGTNLFVLHEGTKVRLVDKVGAWSEIMLSDGNKGWVRDAVFEKI